MAIKPPAGTWTHKLKGIIDMASNTHNDALMSVRGLKVHFPGPRQGPWPWQGRATVKAVEFVSSADSAARSMLRMLGVERYIARRLKRAGGSRGGGG